MKKRKLKMDISGQLEHRHSHLIKLTIIICIIIVVLGIFVVLQRVNGKFSSSFATDISLTYKYNIYDIKENVSDGKMVEELKSLLNGNIFSDNPSCGFSEDISIKLSNGTKKIMLCPALDGCSIIRIDSSNRYFEISDSNRVRLNEILSEYGFEFPSL